MSSTQTVQTTSPAGCWINDFIVDEEAREFDLNLERAISESDAISSSASAQEQKCTWKGVPIQPAMIKNEYNRNDQLAFACEPDHQDIMPTITVGGAGDLSRSEEPYYAHHQDGKRWAFTHDSAGNLYYPPVQPYPPTLPPDYNDGYPTPVTPGSSTQVASVKPLPAQRTGGNPLPFVIPALPPPPRRKTRIFTAPYHMDDTACGQAPYGNTSRKSGPYKTHQKAQSHEKVFRCEALGCQANFRRSHDMKRHYRSIHTDIKPFTCGSCDKHFARMDALKRHTSRVTSACYREIRDIDVITIDSAGKCSR
ncbi:uncharacterized protein EV422DRAFT_506730 [Fimicolochytrium jonesii]|uniref:uncharacterized protein n=1 Tax=Fimicolochytrium jonesii TaxID=1396493 RepID=UPI0022FDE1F9|nr:uncharacterized protein EV422DRAFT_506730 [Fimicolochytrium jonesii]KAI8820496.1 hypothetical protein EV422DRAFT_506730 [Fimicolochytrium jonesii]